MEYPEGENQVGAILILGSSGFIGNRLARQLSKTDPVVGYSRNSSDSLLSFPNYSHITGDFTTEQRFASILREQSVSCIYHCISTTTPQTGTAHALSEVQENLLPTLRLLEAAVACGVERVIFVSSGGTVYGEQRNASGHREDDPLSPICSYGAQKASIEAYLDIYHHVHGLNTIIARVSNPYGFDPRANRSQGIIPIFLRALYEGRGITLFGDTVRDYIHVDDVIHALARLKDYAGTGRIFNIGSGKGVRLQQLVRMIEELAQKPFQSIQYEPIRDCDVTSNVLDIGYIRQELQWEPGIELRDGILRLIGEMQA